MSFTSEQIRQLLANRQDQVKRKKRGTGKVSTCKQVLASFARVLNIYGVPMPEPELRFHPERRWRFDYAWPAHKVALEVEGGVWTGGRHTRGKGFLGDIEKYNSAALMGWRVFRTTPNKLVSNDTVEMIRKAIERTPHADHRG